MKLTKIVLSAAVILGSAFAQAQEIKNGDDLFRAMHDRYAKTWYQTLTFTQKSTSYMPDGTTKVETWHEAVGVPAKLRIDMGDISKNNGIVVADQTGTFFREGKDPETRPLVNMLLVLGFDVYGQDPAVTAKVVKDYGVDLTKMHEDTWQGQPVYVIGASDSSDVKSMQFWVEKKRLLFVRLFEPTKANPEKIQDIRFNDYKEMAGGWVAPTVEVYVSGTKVFSEEYSDIQANVKLPAGVFDPKQYTTTHWEK